MATESVIQGDAYDLLPQLSAGSVDLLLTSPPYWGLRTYGLDHDPLILGKWVADGGEPEVPPPYAWYRDAGGILGLEPYPEWYVAHLVEILERARPALRPSASVWINLGDTYFARWSSIRDGRQGLAETKIRERRRTPSGGWRHDKQLLLLPARFAIAMQDKRWILRNDVIWSKPLVAPRPERDRLRLTHEHFFHFVLRQPSSRPAYYYDLDQVEPGASDVVTVAVSPGGEGHSATFPDQLIRPRIASSSPAGGLVLDPFCGLGTTLVVSRELGRRTIGFELNRQFAEIARTRLIAERDSTATAA